VLSFGLDEGFGIVVGVGSAESGVFLGVFGEIEGSVVDSEIGVG